MLRRTIIIHNKHGNNVRIKSLFFNSAWDNLNGLIVANT